MAVQNVRRNVAYGLSDPLLNVFPAPIVSKRSPTANDHAQIGQTWINTLTNQVYTLSSIVANVANWAVSAVGGGGLTQANADVGFATTIADAMTFAGGVNMSTTAAVHTVTFNVVANPTFAGGVTAQAGITVTGGNILVTAGDVDASGNMTANAVSVDTSISVLAFGAGVVQSNALGVFSSTNGGNGQILIGGGVAPIWTTITPGANIAIVNGANSITISANTGAVDLHYTAVAVTPYVALANDDYMGVDSSGGPITIELPNAPATGRVVVVKDSLGTAAANHITVTTVGGAVLLDGAVSYVLNTNYESAQFIFNGVGYEVY